MSAYCPLCGSLIETDEITLLPERGMVASGGLFALLTGKETAVLQALVEAFPRVLSKEQIMDRIYLGPDEEPEIKIVDVFVCKLRKKIDPLGLRIDTVWGSGYAMAVRVRVADKACLEAAE